MCYLQDPHRDTGSTVNQEGGEQLQTGCDLEGEHHEPVLIDVNQHSNNDQDQTQPETELRRTTRRPERLIEVASTATAITEPRTFEEANDSKGQLIGKRQWLMKFIA